MKPIGNSPIFILIFTGLILLPRTDTLGSQPASRKALFCAIALSTAVTLGVAYRNSKIVQPTPTVPARSFQLSAEAESISINLPTSFQIDLLQITSGKMSFGRIKKGWFGKHSIVDSTGKTIGFIHNQALGNFDLLDENENKIGEWRSIWNGILKLPSYSISTPGAESISVERVPGLQQSFIYRDSQSNVLAEVTRNKLISAHYEIRSYDTNAMHPHWLFAPLFIK